MAFRVETFTSEIDLANFLEAFVRTYTSEDTLQAGLANASNLHSVVTKGNFYIVIDDPLIENEKLIIVTKGNFYTVILETI